MIALVSIIHHLAMALFLGNIFTTLAWKMYAEKSGNAGYISYVLWTALLLDRIITIPTVLITTISGIAMIWLKEINVLQHLWLQISIVLWLISALMAAVYLVPSLKKLHFLANKEVDQEKLSDGFYIKSRRWNIASILLILNPIVILMLMVLKPFS